MIYFAMARRPVRIASAMPPCHSLMMLSVIVLLVILLPGSTQGYNDEKPIYKWSPLFFRSLKNDATEKPSGVMCSPDCVGYRRPIYFGGSLLRLPCGKCEGGLVCRRAGYLTPFCLHTVSNRGLALDGRGERNHLRGNIYPH